MPLYYGHVVKIVDRYNKLKEEIVKLRESIDRYENLIDELWDIFEKVNSQESD